MLNKVILIGRVGQDPKTNENKSVCNFSVATTESYKNKAGEKVENTEWHNISVFGKLVDVADKYIKKGTLLHVEGKIKTEKYTGKDGIEKTSTKIICDSFKMLGSKIESVHAEVVNEKSDDLPF